VNAEVKPMATIGDELSRKIDEAGPGEEIPVIVQFRGDTDREKLSNRGLKVTRSFENISGVSGTALKADLQKIAELEGVERIDYDGQMWAL
jgi:hypothetical protein